MLTDSAQAHRDLVLFLGAGFAWDARLPLMRDFGVQSVLAQRDTERNAQRRRAGSTILRAKETYVAFQQMCVDSALLRPDAWTNVEEVFGVAEALKYAGVTEIALAGRGLTIDELIARIQTWIWKTYQQLPVMRGETRLAANRTPYVELFSLLKKLDLASRATIITTNYDIVPEYFAHLADIPVHYPMPWDPLLGVGSSRRHFVAPPNTRLDGPKLCKLHGSVNFFEIGANELLVAADLGDGSERVGLTPARRFANEPTIAMYDAIWKIQNDHARALPAIVPPSYAKLQDTPWLSATWKEARAALTNADTIIFVGYSLPRTDGFMRSLLAASQVLRTDGRTPRTVVIDRSNAVRQEYRKLYHTIEPRQAVDFARAMERTIPGVLNEIAKS